MQTSVIPFSLAYLFLVSPSFIANWENATLIDEAASAPGLYRCLYRTLGGDHFSISVRGGPCPLSLLANPGSGRIPAR